MISKSEKNKLGGFILFSEANNRYDQVWFRLKDLGGFMVLSHFNDKDFESSFWTRSIDFLSDVFPYHLLY